MLLVITEKPSVARDLARVLGANTRRKAWFEGQDPNGQKVSISWCFGHMCELPNPEHYNPEWKRWRLDTLPMIPAEFELNVRADVREHWQELRRLLNLDTVTRVVNACDAGREGELIFRYVIQAAGCSKDTQRLWVSSLTDEALLGAWANLRPGSEFQNLADAARCRSEADWLIGLNATRAMTCRVRDAGGDQLLSVGRVQTPTLALIVQRDEEIANFVSEKFWRVTAEFEVPTAGEAESAPLENTAAQPTETDASADETQSISDATTEEMPSTESALLSSWTGKYFDPSIAEAQAAEKQGKNAKESKAENDGKESSKAERLSELQTATAIAEAVTGQTGSIVQATKKRKTERTPLLYDLNELQKRANQRYGFSAQRTLDIAQAMYEQHKLLTYPRTDSKYLTPDQQNQIPSILDALNKVPVYSPFVSDIRARPLRTDKRIYNAKEVGDHHAILPTGKDPLRCRLSVDEKKIFDLVARRTLAAFSQDALFDITQLIAVVEPAEHIQLPKDLPTPLHFKAKGKVCARLGWQAVDPPSKRNDRHLPTIEEGDSAPVLNSETHEGKTSPPKHHTEASLLSAMEKAGKDLDDEELKRAMRSSGLGTPATRASIIETLLRRQFIVRDKKKLLSTERGQNLIAAVPVAELKSPQLTGEWEARLAQIAEGNDTRSAFMTDVSTNLHTIIETIRSSDPPTPERILNEDEEDLGACPLCGTPVRAHRNIYTCDTGRSCEFIVYGKIANRKISKRMIKKMLKEGQTQTVKGFKSQRTGREFSAALKLVQGKVKLIFESNRPVAQTANIASKNAPTTPVGVLSSLRTG